MVLLMQFSTTSITLAITVSISGTNFIQIGSEEISYTGISANTLTGVTRGVRGYNSCTHQWCNSY